MNKGKWVVIGGLIMGLGGGGCATTRKEIKSYELFRNPTPSPAKPLSVGGIGEGIGEEGFLTVKGKYQEMLKENPAESDYLVGLLGEEYDRLVPYFTRSNGEGGVDLVAGGYKVNKSAIEDYVNLTKREVH